MYFYIFRLTREPAIFSRRDARSISLRSSQTFAISDIIWYVDLNVFSSNIISIPVSPRISFLIFAVESAMPSVSSPASYSSVFAILLLSLELIQLLTALAADRYFCLSLTFHYQGYSVRLDCILLSSSDREDNFNMYVTAHILQSLGILLPQSFLSLIVPTTLTYIVI